MASEVQEQDDEVVDRNILPYCSIDRKQKKTLGEMEQEFLQALQAFYYDQKAIMSNEEFDNLKEELMWEGSSVVIAKQTNSVIVKEGPRCSLRSHKVYSDLNVDYIKMFLLNVPATTVALGLFFFIDELTGFEINVFQLPEPFGFIFTWFAALPLILFLAQSLTKAIVQDFLILKGPCPNCGTENLSFFGTILSVSSGGTTNKVKCANCSAELEYDSKSRVITLPEASNA
ncbi:PGR5-like protein 1B chloroplastic [Zea mays]|uniref:PGR5-like protein 1B chloroplastic n=1 Tax=Zea mays TaxID=4577 RepID=A0A1D6LCA2_MAIZE|nr:PGR5-like protein 1B chloroplastic [Zea mays]